MTRKDANNHGTHNLLRQLHRTLWRSQPGRTGRPHHSSPSHTASVLTSLAQQRPAFVLAVVVSFTTVLVVVDYRTGLQLSLALFYLIPIALATWSLGRNAGLGCSFISAVLWFATNYVAGTLRLHPGIFVWDTITRLGFFVSVTLLLSALKDALDIERTAARTDYLTMAINRRAFQDVAATEIHRLRRHHRPFTVAYIDVDNFKVVNDTRGHSVGDRLLQTVVRTIASHVRSIDSVARLGGDEFAILLPEADADAAHLVIHRLHHFLLTEMTQHEWPVTFSIGVVTFCDAPDSIDALIGVADGVMYGVKTGHKNAVTYAIYSRERENSVGA